MIFLPAWPVLAQLRHRCICTCGRLHAWLLQTFVALLGMGRCLHGLHARTLRALRPMQVSICPGGVPTGYTYFIPQEEHLESRVVTRSYMEAKMVVALAGR